jgi:hypothetical protein
MITLRQLIEIASVGVDGLFKTRGVIRPMYHCMTAAGVNFVAPAPCEDKDDSIVLMRALFALKNVVRYVFIDEAWIVDKAHVRAAEVANLEAWVAKHGVSNHPDRREVVMFLAEDLAGCLHAHRFILRPEHGKPKLSPLKFITSEAKARGRMIGLLRPSGWPT